MGWCLVRAHKIKPVDGPQRFANLHIALCAQIDLARTSSGWEVFWWISVVPLGKKHQLRLTEPERHTSHGSGGRAPVPSRWRWSRTPGSVVSKQVMIYRHGQEVGPRAPLEPQEVGSGPSLQPRGTCKLWEFREQHISKTSCSFSFLIEKSGFVFCFFFFSESWLFWVSSVSFCSCGW